MTPPSSAYDDAGGVIAARLVWMLRATGHEAALLNGGLTAYRGPLEKGTGSADRPDAAFTARPGPRTDSLAQRTPPTGGTSSSTRAIGTRYRGEQDPVDPRPGHIPGASNLPCRENLAADGTFVAADELRRRFEDAGVREGRRGDLVLRLRRDRLPQPARIGARRLLPGTPLPGLVVAVQPAEPMSTSPPGAPPASAPAGTASALDGVAAHRAAHGGMEAVGRHDPEVTLGVDHRDPAHVVLEHLPEGGPQ